MSSHAEEDFAGAARLAAYAAERRREEGGDPAALGADLRSLATALVRLGRPVEAERIYRDALDVYAAAMPDSPEIAFALHDLAGVLVTLGRPHEAAQVYVEAIARKMLGLGPKHPTVASSLSGLASVEAERDRLPQARLLSRRAVDIARAALGPGDPLRRACEKVGASLRRRRAA